MSTYSESLAGAYLEPMPSGPDQWLADYKCRESEHYNNAVRFLGGMGIELSYKPNTVIEAFNLAGINAIAQHPVMFSRALVEICRAKENARYHTKIEEIFKNN